MSPVSREIRDRCLIISIDHAPVNALSHAVRDGIVTALMDANADCVDTVILICRGRTFFSGADISEFGKPPKAPSLADVIVALEKCAKPVIAAIHGQALGGGLETALACDYRVMDASARLGLPEVTLGLIPGAGGTQRVSRLAGTAIALELAVSGKPISADRAMAAGLIDHISHESLLETALELSQRAPLDKRPVRDMAVPEMDDIAIETWSGFARKKLTGQTAPHAVIEAVRASCQENFDIGLERERELFVDCMSGSQSSAMRHLFFAERKASKLVVPVEEAPLSLQHIGVVGAGTMGVGIAAAMLSAGYDVIMHDVNAEALTVGHDRVSAIIDGDFSKGRITEAEHAARQARLSKATEWADLAPCDLVVEAVFEDMEIKKTVFGALDKVLRPDAILASNTSYLDVDALAEMSCNPERVLGLHFFSPAHIMKLLEIVRGDKTSDAVIVTALKLAKSLRKIGVVCGVCHGFIGNRMLTGYAREAGLLVLEGASPEQVDKALKSFGMPMGPFTMADMAGLDIGYANRKKLSPDQFEARAFRVHDQLVEMGRKGQKTGAGFYRYEGGKRTPLPDASTAEIIASVRTREGVRAREIPETEIVERCIYALINEGAMLLGEGIAQRGSDIDVVYANGYGFPRWRGGPFHFADNVGLSTIRRGIEGLAEQHGNRWWRVAPLLLELESAGGSLSNYTRANSQFVS
jgi:3-hydroxyacyl-CoA dehydrogenase